MGHTPTASLHFSPAIYSIAVPDAILPPTSMWSCGRVSRSLFPTRLYLGNCSLRCPTSCIHAVVLHPWSRAHIALGCGLNVVHTMPARFLARAL